MLDHAQHHLQIVEPPKQDLHHDTLDELWRHFAKSLHILWTGRHPDVDTAGIPWPTGSYGHECAGNDVLDFEAFCVVWEIVGDLDHHCNVLHMNHYGSAKPCWLCQANRTTMNWMDWATTAAWLATITSAAQAAAVARRHPLFEELRGAGVHDLFVRPGMMHTFELGINLYLHGGAMKTLVQAATTCIAGLDSNSQVADLVGNPRGHLTGAPHYTSSIPLCFVFAGGALRSRPMQLWPKLYDTPSNKNKT